MRWFHRHRRIWVWVGASLLVGIWSIASLLNAPDPRVKYDQLRTGMTVAEVEAIYGPAVSTSFDPRINLGSATGRPVIVKAEMLWWYDDHHVFCVAFDDQDVVVHVAFRL